MSSICDNEFLCFCEMTEIHYKGLFLSNDSFVTFDFFVQFMDFVIDEHCKTFCEALAKKTELLAQKKLENLFHFFMSSSLQLHSFLLADRIGLFEFILNKNSKINQ